MSIDYSGLDAKSESISVTITPSSDHPLIVLVREMPWRDLANIVLPELGSTTAKGFLHLGRKLRLCVHLGAYLLQLMNNLTDRQTEWQIKDNAVYQIFCGLGGVDGFRIPDHTKLEEFRSRLSPSTPCRITNLVAKLGVTLNFGDALLLGTLS